MATSLVAALHAVSDTPITLVGGHDGIYEIAVDGDLIYANQGSCAQGFPSDAEVVNQIADRLGFEPPSALASTPVATSGDGPSCPLPAELDQRPTE